MLLSITNTIELNKHYLLIYGCATLDVQPQYVEPRVALLYMLLNIFVDMWKSSCTFFINILIYKNVSELQYLINYKIQKIGKWVNLNWEENTIKHLDFEYLE